MYLGRTSLEAVTEQADLGGFAASKSFSVIVVAYDTRLLLLECLRSLQGQSDEDFETIVIDNGLNDAVRPQLGQFPIRYVRLRENMGACYGRNVGVKLASGQIVLFIDDDAAAHPSLVANCKKAFTDQKIVGSRGKAIPKTDSVYNYFAGNYDFGDEPFPSHVDLECVAAFRREALVRAGGWNIDIPKGMGHEGIELSLRLVRLYGQESLIYHPALIVYHDYDPCLRKLLRKSIRHWRNHLYLKERCPGLEEFLAYYRPWRKARDQGRPVPETLGGRLKFWALRKVNRCVRKRRVVQRVLEGVL